MLLVVRSHRSLTWPELRSIRGGEEAIKAVTRMTVVTDTGWAVVGRVWTSYRLRTEGRVGFTEAGRPSTNGRLRSDEARSDDIRSLLSSLSVC